MKQVRKWLAGLTAAALVGGGSVAYATSADAAELRTGALSQQSLQLTKSNDWITAVAKIDATKTVAVDAYKVCVRDSTGANYDFPQVTENYITTEGATFKDWAQFPPGTYAFSTCVKTKNRGWQKIGDSKSVTVGEKSPYVRDYFDDFSTLDTTKYGIYKGNSRASSVSTWDPKNAFASDGALNLRTQREADGSWTSAGFSSARGFSAVQGKWVVRMKMPKSAGIGYAALLYPKGGGWPPEVDFAEGRFDEDKVVGTFHYSPENRKIASTITTVDLTQFHNWGVEMQGDTITYTIDGKVWATQQSSWTPDVPMWLGVQVNAKPCGGTSTCAGPATPDTSDLQIDWVAHYALR